MKCVRKFKTLCAFIFFFIVTVKGQRVAPGVPPQHYQQQQPPQYQQQIDPQIQHQQQIHVAPGVAPQQYQQQQHGQIHQQIPVQHQVPVQQHQVPIQQQQFQPVVAPGQNVHGQDLHTQQLHAEHQQKVLNTGNLEKERAHIQEHIQVPIDTSKMTDAELQFHYFKIHDSDNNNKLDGCELIKSLIHWHEQGNKEPHNEQTPHVEEKVFSDEELVALIDPILQMDDINRDGYIDYPEFIKAQQKAATPNTQQKQPPSQN